MIEQFIDGYIAAALWATTDDEDNPLDSKYKPQDLSERTLTLIREECTQFYNGYRAWWDDDTQAGIDFFLTRCGHGAGFWDGDYPELNGEVLSDAAKKFGEVWFYVGDDGKIYSTR